MSALNRIATPAAEQSRARYPNRDGLLDRGGVRVFWEEYGGGEPTLLFMPTWSIVHSRCWKLQIPDFARRHRVLTFDPRGNGRSDRPLDPAEYTEDRFAGDALAVMDAAGIESAVLVGLSLGAQRSLIVAAEAPARVAGLALLGPSLNLGIVGGDQQGEPGRFDEDLGGDEGWARYNAHSWRRDYAGFAEFFFAEAISEPHSTKQREDCVEWALQTDAETLILAETQRLTETRTRDLCAAVRCPVLVIHGDDDHIIPYAVGVEAARLMGAELVTFAGSGHLPHARDPVRVNLELRRFVASLNPPAKEQP